MRSIIAIAASLALTLALSACNKPPATAVTAEDMSLGNPNAKVTVIEYGSLGCPHCATWSNEVFPQFKTRYIDTGRVHYVLREALTGAEDISAAGFLLARCSGKDKYFQVVEAVFRAFPNPEDAQAHANAHATLAQIAQQVGLNEQQFTACVTDVKSLNAIQARWTKYATDAKIESTPTFVINGKTYARGVLSLADIDAAVTEAEAAAGKPKT